MSEQLLNIKQLARKLSLQPRTIYEQVKEGRLPAPIRPTKRASRWIESEVDGWILELSNRRTQEGQESGSSSD